MSRLGTRNGLQKSILEAMLTPGGYHVDRPLRREELVSITRLRQKGYHIVRHSVYRITEPLPERSSVRLGCDLDPTS